MNFATNPAIQVNGDQHPGVGRRELLRRSGQHRLHAPVARRGGARTRTRACARSPCASCPPIPTCAWLATSRSRRSCGHGSPRLAPHRDDVRRPDAGFTLVELLVAMVVSIVVVGGATLLAGQMQSSYRAQLEAATAQQEGRFAIQWIERYLRAAGNNPYRVETTPCPAAGTPVQPIRLDPDGDGQNDDIRLQMDANPTNGLIGGAAGACNEPERGRHDHLRSGHAHHRRRRQQRRRRRAGAHRHRRHGPAVRLPQPAAGHHDQPGERRLHRNPGHRARRGSTT